MTPILAFDIETIPDVEGGRRLFGLPDSLSDDGVAEAMMQHRRQHSGSDFLPLPQHCVAAISVTLRNGDGIRVWSLGDEDSEEAEIVTRFFDGIDRFRPTMVSWNGSGFDLPVLHYRALRHGIAAMRYWDVGDEDREFKWNNYLNRFHWRHVDLMDVLAAYQARATAKLEHMALLVGLPGKLGMHGSKVWGAWQEGRRGAVRDYCETDALNTYLLYLRFRFIRGELNDNAFQREIDQVVESLEQSDASYAAEFLAHWDQPRFRATAGGASA